MTPLLIELIVLTAAAGLLRLARGRGTRLFQRIPVVPTLLLAHAVAVALVVAFGVTGATRPGLVFAFVCLVPGAALVGLVALHDLLTETVLSLALSLTLVLLAALAAAALNRPASCSCSPCCPPDCSWSKSVGPLAPRWPPVSRHNGDNLVPPAGPAHNGPGHRACRGQEAAHPRG